MALTLGVTTVQRGAPFMVPIIGAADRSNVSAFASDNTALTIERLYVTSIQPPHAPFQIGWVLRGVLNAGVTVSLVEYLFLGGAPQISTASLAVQAGALSPSVSTYAYSGMGPFYTILNDVPVTSAVNAVSSDGVSVTSRQAYVIRDGVRVPLVNVFSGTLRFGGNPTLTATVTDYTGVNTTLSGLPVGAGGVVSAKSTFAVDANNFFIRGPAPSAFGGRALGWKVIRNNGADPNGATSPRWRKGPVNLIASIAADPTAGGLFYPSGTSTGNRDLALKTGSPAEFMAGTHGYETVSSDGWTRDGVAFDPTSANTTGSMIVYTCTSLIKRPADSTSATMNSTLTYSEDGVVTIAGTITGNLVLADGVRDGAYVAIEICDLSYDQLIYGGNTVTLAVDADTDIPLTTRQMRLRNRLTGHYNDIDFSVSKPSQYLFVRRSTTASFTKLYNELFPGVVGTITFSQKSTYGVSLADAVADLAAGTPTGTTVPLTFTSGPVNAVTYQYRVRSSATGNALITDWTTLASDKTVTGLTASTGYLIDVRPVNVLGAGGASNAVTVTTAAAAQYLYDGATSNGTSPWTFIGTPSGIAFNNSTKTLDWTVGSAASGFDYGYLTMTGLTVGATYRVALPSTFDSITGTVVANGQAGEVYINPTNSQSTSGSVITVTQMRQAIATGYVEFVPTQTTMYFFVRQTKLTGDDRVMKLGRIGLPVQQ